MIRKRRSTRVAEASKTGKIDMHFWVSVEAGPPRRLGTMEVETVLGDGWETQVMPRVSDVMRRFSESLAAVESAEFELPMEGE